MASKKESFLLVDRQVYSFPSSPPSSPSSFPSRSAAVEDVVVPVVVVAVDASPPRSCPLSLSGTNPLFENSRGLAMVVRILRRGEGMGE